MSSLLYNYFNREYKAHNFGKLFKNEDEFLSCYFSYVICYLNFKLSGRKDIE